MGKTIAFMEATISNPEGVKLAHATASARLVPVEKLPAQRAWAAPADPQRES